MQLTATKLVRYPRLSSFIGPRAIRIPRNYRNILVHSWINCSSHALLQDSAAKGILKSYYTLRRSVDRVADSSRLCYRSVLDIRDKKLHRIDSLTLCLRLEQFFFIFRTRASFPELLFQRCSSVQFLRRILQGSYFAKSLPRGF